MEKMAVNIQRTRYRNAVTTGACPRGGNGFTEGLQLAVRQSLQLHGTLTMLRFGTTSLQVSIVSIVFTMALTAPAGAQQIQVMVLAW